MIVLGGFKFTSLMVGAAFEEHLKGEEYWIEHIELLHIRAREERHREFSRSTRSSSTQNK